MWLIAILGWRQLAPGWTCSFVKISGSYNASEMSTHGGVTQDDCFRLCYDESECIIIVYTKSADNGSCHIYRKSGLQQLPEGEAYELRRDEEKNCERRVTMNVPRTAQKTTTTGLDVKHSSTPDSGTRTPTGCKHLSSTDKCYQVFSEFLSFTSAEERCKSKNGSLASIHSREQNAFLEGLFTSANINSIAGAVWIGLYLPEAHTNINEAGEWTDGSMFDFRNWEKGEPFNKDGAESCTEHPVDGGPRSPMLATADRQHRRPTPIDSYRCHCQQN
ncbi:hypothetical protein Y032_0019g3755 [Ancylostoma ceylanicum]|nr:hypothetical protein Y032_0019g3755 [Ancylostoma ceylanicum]